MAIHPNDTETVENALKLAKKLEDGAKAIRDAVAMLDGIDYVENQAMFHLHRQHYGGNKLFDFDEAIYNEYVDNSYSIDEDATNDANPDGNPVIIQTDE
jgi:hypothetical protein